jgi:hypothetical protein
MSVRESEQDLRMEQILADVIKEQEASRKAL